MSKISLMQEPLLRFSLPASDTAAGRLCRRVVHEMAVRLGVPYTCHNPGEHIPAGGHNLRVSEAETEQNSSICDIGRRIPLTAGDHRPRLILSQNASSRNVWTIGEPDLSGLFSGLVELASFSSEASVDRSLLDGFGRLPPQSNPMIKAGIGSEALFENNVLAMRTVLEQRTGKEFPEFAPWGPRKYAAVLTHDVDGPQLHSAFALFRSAVYAFLRRNRRERESFELGVLTKVIGGEDPYWNFSKWSELETALGIRSTTFVYPGPVTGCARHKRDPHYDPGKGVFAEALHSVVQQGGEIGIHCPINAETTSDYRRSHDKLVALGLSRVSGNRAHYWANDWFSPEKNWRAMAEAGLKYDCSLSLMALGLRGGSILPFCPLKGHDMDGVADFCAFPTAIMDAYVMPRETGIEGAKLHSMVQDIIGQARAHHGLVMMDWHIRSLSNVGAWRGYLAPLIRLLLELRSDSDCVFLTAKQAQVAWTEHAHKLCLNYQEAS